MNKLMDYYNREIRLPNIVDQTSIYEEKIKSAQGLKSILIPSHYAKLLSRTSAFINQKRFKLFQLRKKKMQLKDILGVN